MRMTMATLVQAIERRWNSKDVCSNVYRWSFRGFIGATIAIDIREAPLV